MVFSFYPWFMGVLLATPLACADLQPDGLSRFQNRQDHRLQALQRNPAVDAPAGAGKLGDGRDATAQFRGGRVGRVDEDAVPPWHALDPHAGAEAPRPVRPQAVAALRDAAFVALVAAPRELDAVAYGLAVQQEGAVGAVGMVRAPKLDNQHAAPASMAGHGAVDGGFHRLLASPYRAINDTVSLQSPNPLLFRARTRA